MLRPNWRPVYCKHKRSNTTGPSDDGIRLPTLLAVTAAAPSYVRDQYRNIGIAPPLPCCASSGCNTQGSLAPMQRVALIYLCPSTQMVFVGKRASARFCIHRNLRLSSHL